MTTTAIAVADKAASGLAFGGSIRIDSLAEVFRLADRLAEAKGFIPTHLLGNPNGIAAAILTGIELGLGPMEAMRSIHIVEGKPTLAADLMLARAIRAGVKPTWLQSDARLASLKLERPGFAPYTSNFSIDDAKNAGLAGRGNWTKYAPAMLRARAVSAGMRAFCPDVLGSNVYTPDELEAEARAETAQRVEIVSYDGEAKGEPYTEAPEPKLRAMALADISDEADLHEWCAANARKVGKLEGARRASAEKSITEAAARCGVSAEVALAWAGLSATAEAAAAE